MGVGELIGKLFGGTEASNETLLRAYGKLPMYAEYRRLEVSPGAPTAFSQWMDAGRLAWVKASSKSGAGATRASRLMINIPESKDIVVANVWDSRDSLGRVFPFSFFAVCPAVAFGPDPVEQWVCALTMHRTFERTHAELRSLGTGGNFYRLFQKRSMPLRSEDVPQRAADLRADAARISARAWFDTIPHDEGVDAGAWFAGLLRRIERWKAEPARLAEAALSCPLSAEFPFDTQVVLWLEWMRAASTKLGRRIALLVPAESERSAGAVHLLLRDVLADDFQLLTSDDANYGYIERLNGVPNGNDAAAAPAPEGSLLNWLAQHAPQGA